MLHLALAPVADGHQFDKVWAARHVTAHNRLTELRPRKMSSSLHVSQWHDIPHRLGRLVLGRSYDDLHLPKRLTLKPPVRGLVRHDAKHVQLRASQVAALCCCLVVQPKVEAQSFQVSQAIQVADNSTAAPAHKTHRPSKDGAMR